MSSQEVIEELCRICAAQSRIIQVQSSVLAQMDAMIMEEEVLREQNRLEALAAKWIGEVKPVQNEILIC